MKRMLLASCWILAFSLISSAQTTFYFPHIANGTLGNPVTVWKTTMFLANPSSAPASGTITFKADNASAAAAGLDFPVTFTDESGLVTTGSIAFTIGSGQSKKYVSSGTGAYSPGFAIVSTTAGTVTGTAVFSEFDQATGALIAEAGVPQASALTKQAVFVDTVGGYNIGVAYANPGPAAASITFSLLSAGGATVASTTQQLGPGNHAAGFTSGLFTSVTTQLSGTMQVQSTSPLATIALRFDPNFKLFTTLPPVSIASLISPAINWLEERPWLAPL